MQITVESFAQAPLEAVWQAWTTPDEIMKWNAAAPDWRTTQAEVDLRVGGAFRWRIEARDGSVGYDVEGVYTELRPLRRLAARSGDHMMRVSFLPEDGGVRVVETFDVDDPQVAAEQCQGHQAVLDRFCRHVAMRAAPLECPV